MSLKRISHDDAQHYGSAQRGVGGGVAALSSSGAVKNAAGFSVEMPYNKGTGDGYAGLDASAKIIQVQMPDLLIQSQTPQVLTGAGVISLTTAITHLVTASGADAITLADGAEGQHKTIIMKTITTGGDTSIITPTHFANGSTITGNSVGDIQNLMFSNGAWHWTGGRGAIIA